MLEGKDRERGREERKREGREEGLGKRDSESAHEGGGCEIVSLSLSLFLIELRPPLHHQEKEAGIRTLESVRPYLHQCLQYRQRMLGDELMMGSGFIAKFRITHKNKVLFRLGAFSAYGPSDKMMRQNMFHLATATDWLHQSVGRSLVAVVRLFVGILNSAAVTHSVRRSVRVATFPRE